MDQQDLQNQQNLQEKINNILVTDLFQAAKLQQNYFVRSQNNKNQNQFSKAFNLDEEEVIVNEAQINKKTNNLKQDEPNKLGQQNTKQDSKKKNTDKKRRKKPLKNKKQSIFDDNSQQNEEQEFQKQQTQQKPIPQNKINLQTKNDQQINFKKQRQQKSQQQISYPNQGKYAQSLYKNIQKNDDFDNIIKDQEQQRNSSKYQKVTHLHEMLNSLTKQKRKAYLYEPLKVGKVALGYFKRVSSGLSDMYQFLGQDYRPIMFCENQRGCIGCNYYISLTKQMDKNKPSYLGKLRGNATGSLYNLYDCGMQPKKQMDRSQWRVSLAAIEYQSNFMGFNGPRKLKVTVPSPKHFLDPDNFKLSEEESLLSLKLPVIAQFRNKTPKWNQKLKSYALNFGGRVKLASIKNFILISNEFSIEQEDEADNVIIFGKVDQSTFSVEYRYPLSLFQAFGIIMSEFDFKLNCE